ncbi:hypothetical protein HQ585_09895 [candidate division KSB1 bacterium]|nr:hypothetical protein [candidate division KSB1 bacterium]
MVKRSPRLAITCFVAVFVLTVQGAGIPQLINYQSVLLDGDDDPITDNR